MPEPFRIEMRKWNYRIVTRGNQEYQANDLVIGELHSGRDYSSVSCEIRGTLIEAVDLGVLKAKIQEN